MKLYTFHVEDSPEEILCQVRAESHTEAVAKSGIMNDDTDFYSEEIEE